MTVIPPVSRESPLSSIPGHRISPAKPQMQSQLQLSPAPQNHHLQQHQPKLLLCPWSPALPASSPPRTLFNEWSFVVGVRGLTPGLEKQRRSFHKPWANKWDLTHKRLWWPINSALAGIQNEPSLSPNWREANFYQRYQETFFLSVQDATT